MKTTSLLHTIAYCLFPLLLYYIVYEIAASVLLLGVQVLAGSGGARASVWIVAHAADVSALITALAMAAGFAVIHKTAAQEAPYALRISCRAGDAAAAFLLALSSAIFLNLILSISGAAAADAGASSAGRQTANVSLPLGLVFYGVLSPFIEETLFRGITFGRIYRALHRSGPQGVGRNQAGILAENRSLRRCGAQSRGESIHASQEPPGGPNGHVRDTAFLAAAVLSSVLFGAYHGNIVQGFYAFCMGMVFCGIVKLTGSLTAAAASHGAVNAVTLILSQSGSYEALCTASWAAAFLGIAGCCGTYLVVKKGNMK